jgi:HAD superfamily hydrolase (TIGR01549 family)
LKVLYYLEPWVELDFPLFRLGTIRNHLRKEAANLLQSGYEVALMCSEAISWEVEKAGLLPSNLKRLTVSKQQLNKFAPNYFTASMQPFRSSEDGGFLEQYACVIRDSLQGFEPDIIIAYETAFSRYLRVIFPEALVLDSTLGAFSREPYPETFCYDPFGSFAESALNTFDINELCPDVDLDQATEFIDPIRAGYASTLTSASPFNEMRIRKKHDAVLLLPLQVSKYFAFDAFLPANIEFNSQFEYLCWVLESVPKNIGVYVTEHGFSPVITDRNHKWLKSQYSNFIYDDANRDVKWVSQYLLQHVDGVITVSSSLGFQAALYNKFLCVPGCSHLSSLADASSLASISIEAILQAKNKSKYLYFLLNKYNPLFEKYVLQDNWHANFLEKMHSMKKANLLDENSFSLIDDPNTIRDQFLNGMRPCPVNKARTAISGKKHQKIDESKVVPYRMRITAMKESIDAAKVVSFDVFDTLLIRNYLSPEQLNIYIADKSSRQLRDWGYVYSAGDYYDLRKKSASRLLKRSREIGVEDVTLREIFNELRKNLKISKDEAAALRKIEIDAEFKSIGRRKDFYGIYKYALERNKKIYFVSDMYLDEDFVRHLLSKHGFDAGHTLLLSSAVGKLKKTGSLYDHLIESAAVPAHKIYHIGDNEISDFKAAERKGINAMLVNKVSDILLSNEALLNAFPASPSDVWSGLQQGISARLMSENGAHGSQSIVAGSPFLLGAICGGPIILGFAKWIFDQVTAKNVGKVFFLARDGWYPKQAFDMINNITDGKIQSEYLLASRRAVIGSAIYDKSDILASLDAAFSECTLEFFLESRFGICCEAHYQEEELLSLGATLDMLVDSKKDDTGAVLSKVLEGLEAVILENAQSERDAYVRYLEDVGFMGEEKVAIVDIGHNGTLQLGLGKLTSRTIEGFYFATFKKASQLVKQKHGVNSYLLQFEDSSRSEHFYCKNIGMFEFLFIPNQASFSRMASDSKLLDYKPEFVPYDESKRRRIAEKVEEGINYYCREFVKTLGRSIENYFPDLHTVTAPYKHFIENPSKVDVEMIRDVSFSDAFGGSKSRYLIDPQLFSENVLAIDEGMRHNLIRGSWWRAGAKALLDSEEKNAAPKVFLGWRERFLKPFFRPFVYRMANKKNRDYFEYSPRQFFSSLSNRRYRLIGKFFFGV